jgi:hypothetical protein
MTPSLVDSFCRAATRKVVQRAEEESEVRVHLAKEIVGEILTPNRKTNNLLYQRLNAMKMHKLNHRPVKPQKTVPCDIDSKGEFQMNSNYHYLGDSLESKPHGEGTMWTSRGDVYQGTFLFGRRHGVGSFWSSSGAYYTGEFKDDVIDGIGEYHWPDGHLYHGSFSQNKKHGIGAMWYQNCDFYEGEWQLGKRHGKGLALYARGTWVKGEFRTGAYYDGDWTNDKRHGLGTYRFSNGDVYKGEFVNGNIFGEGRFSDAHNGMSFKGKMVNMGLGGENPEPLRPLSKGVYWHAHGTCKMCGNIGVCKGHAYMYSNL